MKFIPDRFNMTPTHFRKPGSKTVVIATAVLLLLLAALVAACSSSDSATDEETGVTTTNETGDDTVSETEDKDEVSSSSDQDESSTDQSPVIENEESQPEPVTPDEAWLSSPHADSYVKSSAERNDTCARCHSPVQWLPGPEDIPESCLTCKFDVDEPEPLISEQDWEHVPCKTCHRIKKDEVEPEAAWLDIAVIEEYIDIDSTTELCQKCHEESEQSGHKPAFTLSDDHADLECTDCHDSHATIVNCTGSGCHEDILVEDTSIAGHDADHGLVSCIACHDAAELQVGPSEDGETWQTFITVAGDGEERTVPHSSHQTQVEVACDRCHFSGNPWDLSDAVTD
jgi:hypothetical protein